MDKLGLFSDKRFGNNSPLKGSLQEAKKERENNIVFQSLTCLIDISHSQMVVVTYVRFLEIFSFYCLVHVARLNIDCS